MCVRVYVYVCVRVYVCVHVFIDTGVHLSRAHAKALKTSSQFAASYMCACTCLYVYVCVRVYVCACTCF